MSYSYTDAIKDIEKMKLGSTLRKLRERAGISAKDIPDLLKCRGFDVKYSTYMGYENNNSIPNADVFLALCDILEIHDILHAFGYGASIYPSFDSKELRNHPYFRLVDEYCLATGLESKQVFDYFCAPDHSGDLQYLFAHGKPKIPDEVAVSKMLGLSTSFFIYTWGEKNGYWLPDLKLTSEERNFIIKHRELSQEESSVS